MMHFGLACSH